MAGHGEVVLCQRVCFGCQAVFWICHHCDRGHRYCNLACRTQARLQQHRRANCRYQRSPEGRLDHRDRQRAYRCRQRKSVTDPGSLSIAFPAPSPHEIPQNTALPQEMAENTATPYPATTPTLRWFRLRHSRFPRCIICGRSSRWVDPFPRFPRCFG